MYGITRPKQDVQEMKKEVTVELTEEHISCDICDTRIGVFGYQCVSCKKDLCKNHVYYNDHHFYLCEECYKLQEGYKQKIGELNKQINELYIEWKNKLKEMKK